MDLFWLLMSIKITFKCKSTFYLQTNPACLSLLACLAQVMFVEVFVFCHHCVTLMIPDNRYSLTTLGLVLKISKEKH